jgi:FAD/FMN-containing dehydrogenase
MTALLSNMELHTLKAKTKGSVIEVYDPQHRGMLDELVWNGRKPVTQAQYVVRAETEEDVQLAMKFASANGLSVSPRGGGHHFTGIALAGDVIIDVSGLCRLQIAPDRKTAIVGPGVTNERLAAALERNGLAFPVGHCATVPLSGYLLGGGVGWNAGEWGIACFSVNAAEVILPDGSKILATMDDHQEILWAVRGAGPEFFGVVTAYHVDLKPLPKGMMAEVHVFAPEDARKVGEWAEKAMKRAPANIEFTVKISAPPPEANAPAGAFGLAVIANAFAGSEPEAVAMLCSLFADAPNTAMERIGPMPAGFDMLYSLTSVSTPKGKRYGVDTLWSDADFGDVLEGMVEGYKERPSFDSFGLVCLSSPLAAEPGYGAFSRTGRIMATLYTIWDDPRADTANLGWMRKVMGSLAPMASGTYVGESDLEHPNREMTIHSPEVAVRLTDLRSKYDPGQVMRTLATSSTRARAA